MLAKTSLSRVASGFALAIVLSAHFVNALAAEAGHSGLRDPALGSDEAASVRIAELASSITWKRLLYIQTGKPEINEKRFYLSAFPAPQLELLPASELRATLAQADAPVAEGEDANLHPRCLFPARYFWLGQMFEREDWKRAPPFCVKLRKWLDERPAGAFSLLMVSGYVTNPGSTFGHTLIRLSSANKSDSTGNAVSLLDATFNFGAGIPENEPIPIYIARGLFGGYTSAFTTGTYFQHDQVYSRQEMRDLWSYDLLLTPEESEMARLRVAELLGYRFDYFFLSHNCALRMGQLFDLVTGQSRFPDNPVFMTPIELFHRLNNTDNQARALLGDVTFVPSHHRLLTHRINDFKPAQKAVYKQLASVDNDASSASIFADRAALSQALSKSGDPSEQVAVVDAALSFWEARILAKQEKDVELERQRKDRLLKVRLMMPVNGVPSAPVVEPLPRPDDSNHVMGLSLGLASGERNHFMGGRTGLQLRVTPYKYDNESFHAIQNFGQLRVLDGRLFLNHEGKLQLNRLEVMKVSSVANLDQTGLDHIFSQYFSWEMDVGLDRLTNSGRYLDKQQMAGFKGLDGYARFAVGPSVKFSNSVLLSARATNVIGTISDWYTFYPELAVEYRSRRLRASLQATEQRFTDVRASVDGRFVSIKATVAYALENQRNLLVWLEQRSGRLDNGVAGASLEWRF